MLFYYLNFCIIMWKRFFGGVQWRLVYIDLVTLVKWRFSFIHSFIHSFIQLLVILWANCFFYKDSSGPSLMAKDHDIEDRRYNTNSLQVLYLAVLVKGQISLCDRLSSVVRHQCTKSTYSQEPTLGFYKTS